MYDYKFRHKDPSFKETKHFPRKMLLLAVGLALVAGVLYGIIFQGPARHSGSEVSETDSDIIPLSLPPYTGPKENTRPIDSASTSRQRS